MKLNLRMVICCFRAIAREAYLKVTDRYSTRDEEEARALGFFGPNLFRTTEIVHKATEPFLPPQTHHPQETKSMVDFRLSQREGVVGDLVTGPCLLALARPGEGQVGAPGPGRRQLRLVSYAGHEEPPGAPEDGRRRKSEVKGGC